MRNRADLIVMTILSLSLLLVFLGPNLVLAKKLDKEIQEAQGNQDNFYREALNGKSVSCHNVNDARGNYIEGEYEVRITIKGSSRPIVKKVEFTRRKDHGGNSTKGIEVPEGAWITQVEVVGV